MKDSNSNVTAHESNMQESQHLAEPFLSNPFRLLRLPASARNDEIHARYQEARIQAQLASKGMQQEILDELRRAQGELLDQRKRLLHEAGWFYNPPPLLFEGAVPQLDQVLEGYREKVLAPDQTGTLAKHDYANWLLLHACHADDSESQRILCLRALASWSELLTDTAYLEILRSTSVNEPINNSVIWHKVVFAALAEAARRQIRMGNWLGTKPYIEAVKIFGADTKQILSVAGPALTFLQDNGRNVLKEIKEERGKIPLTTEAAQEWAGKVEKAFMPLHELEEFIEEDDFVESRGILDDAAELLRSVAIALNNEVKAYTDALGLLFKANDLAGSEDFQTRLEADLRQVRENTFQWALARAVEFGEHEMWNDATQSIDYAEGIAGTDQEQKAISSLRTALATRRAHRKRRPYVVACIMGAIIVIPTIAVVLSNAFSGSQESVQPPVIMPPATPALMTPSRPPQATASVPRPTPRLDRSDLLAQIRVNEARLSALESQIDTIEAELNGYKIQIEAIRARYPSLRAPEPYYSQHNSLVRQYNSRLDTRDKLVTEYDNLVNSNNALVDRYNRNR